MGRSTSSMKLLFLSLFSAAVARRDFVLRLARKKGGATVDSSRSSYVRKVRRKGRITVRLTVRLVLKADSQSTPSVRLWVVRGSGAGNGI